MLAGLEAGDPDQQVGRAWIAPLELQLLYREPSRHRAERRLLRWFTTIAEHQIPELVRLASTLDAWRPELLAYFDTGGVSNGPTEAINELIKKIKRIGHGYRNLTNHRLRLLLRCGVDWHTPTVTRSESGYHATGREQKYVLAYVGAFSASASGSSRPARSAAGWRLAGPSAPGSG
jgi:transposase